MVFCVVFVVASELFQTIVQGGVLKYTSQFLLQVTTMPTCVGSRLGLKAQALLTCGRKDDLQLRNTSVYLCCCDSRPE